MALLSSGHLLMFNECFPGGRQYSNHYPGMQCRSANNNSGGGSNSNDTVLIIASVH